MPDEFGQEINDLRGNCELMVAKVELSRNPPCVDMIRFCFFKSLIMIGEPDGKGVHFLLRIPAQECTDQRGI